MSEDTRTREELLERVYECACQVLFGYPESLGVDYNPYTAMREAVGDVFMHDYPHRAAAIRKQREENRHITPQDFVRLLMGATRGRDS